MSTQLKCPFCGMFETKVKQTRSLITALRRERICKVCLKAFITIETIVNKDNVSRKKSNG